VLLRPVVRLLQFVLRLPAEHDGRAAQAVRHPLLLQ
jgi:hypothetical protein